MILAWFGRNSSEHRAHAAKEERHPSAEGGPKGSVEAVADGPASHQAIPTRARWATDENARGSAVCDAECLPCRVVTWRTRISRASKLVVERWPLSALLSALCSLFTPLILLAVRGPRFARQLSRWLSRRLACMPLWRLLSSQWGSLWGTFRLRGESKYAGGPDANPPSRAARGTPPAVRSM